eukprot:PhM_4_TR17387/c3_g1_i2/m.32800
MAESSLVDAAMAICGEMDTSSFDQELVKNLCTPSHISSLRASGDTFTCALFLRCPSYVTAETLPFACNRAGLLRITPHCSHLHVFRRPGCLSLAMMLYNSDFTGTPQCHTHDTVHSQLELSPPAWMVDRSLLPENLRGRIPESRFSESVVAYNDSLLAETASMPMTSVCQPQITIVFQRVQGFDSVLRTALKTSGLLNSVYTVSKGKIRVTTAAAQKMIPYMREALGAGLGGKPGFPSWACVYDEAAFRATRLFPSSHDQKGGDPTLPENPDSEPATVLLKKPVSTQLVAYVLEALYDTS